MIFIIKCDKTSTFGMSVVKVPSIKKKFCSYTHVARTHVFIKCQGKRHFWWQFLGSLGKFHENVLKMHSNNPKLNALTLHTAVCTHKVFFNILFVELKLSIVLI